MRADFVVQPAERLRFIGEGDGVGDLETEQVLVLMRFAVSTSTRPPFRAANPLLVIWIGALAISGCTGGTTSPSPSVSAAASATVTASQSQIASATSSPSPSPSPRPNGVFSTTGSMVVDRTDGATSTLLADGRVLVTGGTNGAVAPGSFSSAEIYDPAAGHWTLTGSMTSAHAGQTATLLKDGRVLIVAGCDTHSTAEMYDPVTGKFALLGKVAVENTCSSTATLLPDGRVLIAGGYDSSNLASKVAELFDPASGKFTKTGSLHTARGNAQAALLPDGRVLIIGGDQSGRTPSEVDLDSSEIYDPTTGKFSDAAKMETPRTNFSATLLADGKVLVAGGAYNSAAGGVFLDSAELYDPATGQFSPTGAMTFGRISDLGQSHGTWGTIYTGLLADGRVLIVGGNDLQSPTGQATAEIYDPATGKFSATTSPPQDHSPYGIPSVTLKDGRVLMPGAPSLLYTP